MKKEFEDLETDVKKEYLFMKQLAYELPYTLALVPFIIISLTSKSTIIGIASLIIFFIIAFGYSREIKKLNKVYGL